MTASPRFESVNTAAQADPVSIRRQTAIFLIIEFLLIFAPLIILGAAINWPASLDEPLQSFFSAQTSRSQPAARLA